jgi:hypothetical protein
LRAGGRIDAGGRPQPIFIPLERAGKMAQSITSGVFENTSEVSENSPGIIQITLRVIENTKTICKKTGKNADFSVFCTIFAGCKVFTQNNYEYEKEHFHPGRDDSSGIVRNHVLRKQESETGSRGESGRTSE